MSTGNKEIQSFVENRVQKIRILTESRNWYYCNTTSNPVVLLTRIRNFSNFQNCDLWWVGPNFTREKLSMTVTNFNNFELNVDQLKSAMCLQ